MGDSNDVSLLVVSFDSVLTWLDDRHCVKVFRPHDDWIRQAIPSIDGRYILTTSNDQVPFLLRLS